MTLWWLWIVLVTPEGPYKEPVAIFTDPNQCTLTAHQLTTHPDNEATKFYCVKVTKT